MSKIKVIAFDLDGTITQHKQPPVPANRAALEALSKKYKLVMAPTCIRAIFNNQIHHSSWLNIIC